MKYSHALNGMKLVKHEVLGFLNSRLGIFVPAINRFLTMNQVLMISRGCLDFDSIFYSVWMLTKQYTRNSDCILWIQLNLSTFWWLKMNFWFQRPSQILEFDSFTFNFLYTIKLIQKLRVCCNINVNYSSKKMNKVWNFINFTR